VAPVSAPRSPAWFLTSFSALRRSGLQPAHSWHDACTNPGELNVVP
jgi:hypothetical protein